MHPALGKTLRWLALALCGAVALVLLFAAARIVLHRQTDDPVHLAEKRDYLDRIAGITGGSPAGPNVVLILFDDLGYGDLGVYGSGPIRTPRIDALAAGGVFFRNAYSASPYCSASRAGLLTGRHALRSGMDHVVQAPWTSRDLLLRLGWRNRRLPAEEITLPEILSAAGYATGMFGKWHLGDESPSLPNDRGFDTFHGLLFSNDQGEPVFWKDREIVEAHPIDQTTLTRRYTERAVAFIEENRERRFFLYLPQTFPHVPLHASAERRGGSAGGLYGDVVEELDWSVGVVLDALERNGLTGETLVVVTSDNGPWFQGSAGGVRGRKLGVFEGGMRVPFIASWPGRISAERSSEDLVVAIDVLPTVLELAGLPLPVDRVIDGRSLVELLDDTGPGPHDVVYYHQIDKLRAVRSGDFKYHDRHGVFYGNPMDWSWGPMKQRGPWLFDLASDPDESYDVSELHPAVARELRGTMETWRRELAANPRGWR